MSTLFDPLDYENLGASMARALGEQDVMGLENLVPFDGAGIYALYYTGKHPAYSPLARINRETPGSWAIYVGKAEADGSRKGNLRGFDRTVGSKLFQRISRHRKSIEAATNLDIADFQYRALPLVPTWISLAEVIAIRLNHPVWNTIVDGLGNHDPGAGRHQGMRPRWDTLHPGRPWAQKLQPRNETAQDIIQDSLAFLNTNHP